MTYDDDYDLNWLHTPFRPYDGQIGRWMVMDPLAAKYPSLSPYNYAANNPLLFTDINGDSLISVRIVNSEGFIHGDDEVTIDHTYLNDFTNILQAAVNNRTHIHINSSFRSTAQQNSPAIQQQGTTPVQGGTSRHEAGFAVDFNLYQGNDVSRGLLQGNQEQNRDNNSFLQAIVDNSSRWGGDFSTPDRIHFDAGDDNMLSTRLGVGFATTRDANQAQFANRGVTRTVSASFLIPLMQLPLSIRGLR